MGKSNRLYEHFHSISKPRTCLEASAQSIREIGRFHAIGAGSTFVVEHERVSRMESRVGNGETQQRSSTSDESRENSPGGRTRGGISEPRLLNTPLRKLTFVAPTAFACDPPDKGGHPIWPRARPVRSRCFVARKFVACVFHSAARASKTSKSRFAIGLLAPKALPETEMKHLERVRERHCAICRQDA